MRLDDSFLAATRDEILELVRLGKLPTASADRWAAKRNDTFVVEPKFDEDGAIHLDQWSPAMVLAWIADRSLRSVYFVSQACSESTFVWRPSTSEDADGYELGHPRLPSVEKIAARYGLLGNRFAEQLHFALRTGDLAATGLPASSQDRIVVPKEAWTHVGGDPFEALPIPTIGKEHFIDVSCSRAAVTAIWPARPKPGDRLLPSAKTLPANFAHPSWSSEHVLAWIAVRDADLLAKLESPHPDRPAFYGTLCAPGYFDEGAANDLLAVLADNSLHGRRGTRPATYDGSRDYLTAVVNQGVWYVQAEVLGRWSIDGTAHASAGQTKTLHTRKTKLPAPDANAASIEAKKPRQPKIVNSQGIAGEKPSRELPATVSVDAACDLTGLGRTTLYKVMKAGRIRFTIIGKRRLIFRESLMDFLSLNNSNAVK